MRASSWLRLRVLPPLTLSLNQSQSYRNTLCSKQGKCNLRFQIYTGATKDLVWSLHRFCKRQWVNKPSSNCFGQLIMLMKSPNKITPHYTTRHHTICNIPFKIAYSADSAAYDTFSSTRALCRESMSSSYWLIFAFKALSARPMREGWEGVGYERWDRVVRGSGVDDISDRIAVCFNVLVW